MGIADGPTEVHKVTVAKQVLKDYRPDKDLFPGYHLPKLHEAALDKYGAAIDELKAAVAKAARQSSSGRAKTSSSPRQGSQPGVRIASRLVQPSPTAAGEPERSRHGICVPARAADRRHRRDRPHALLQRAGAGRGAGRGRGGRRPHAAVRRRDPGAAADLQSQRRRASAGALGAGRGGARGRRGDRRDARLSRLALRPAEERARQPGAAARRRAALPRRAGRWAASWWPTAGRPAARRWRRCGPSSTPCAAGRPRSAPRSTAR